MQCKAQSPSFGGYDADWFLMKKCDLSYSTRLLFNFNDSQVRSNHSLSICDPLVLTK